MELQLDSLIDKIKSNGIQEGERQAQELRVSAEKEAAEILSRAKQQAEGMVNAAQNESEALLKRGKDALKQAERDLLLSVEKELKDLLNKFLQNCTEEALSADKLSDIIKQALSSWTFGSNDNVFIHLSKSDADKINKEAISAALKDKSTGLEIKVDSSIVNGFRISKGSDGFAFDFSADAVSEALAVFLTPNIRELLR